MEATFWISFAISAYMHSPGNDNISPFSERRHGVLQRALIALRSKILNIAPENRQAASIPTA